MWTVCCVLDFFLFQLTLWFAQFKNGFCSPFCFCFLLVHSRWSRFDDVNELQKTMATNYRAHIKGAAEQMPTKTIHRTHKNEFRWLQSNNEKSIISAAAATSNVIATAASDFSATEFFSFLAQKDEAKRSSEREREREREERKRNNIENKNEAQLRTNCFALYKVQ